MRTTTINTSELLIVDAGDCRMTEDGYLTATPRVARIGIQLYKGIELGRKDMDTVRVWRPEVEVMHKDAMASIAHRPITNDHPSEPVTAGNWKKYAVGQAGDEVARDGDFIRVPLALMDAGVISDFRDGKKQLSLGYVSQIEWRKGTTEQGDDYDAVQSNIRVNHIAVVKAARGGPKLAIGDQQITGVNDEQQENTMTGTNTATVSLDLRTVDVDGHSIQVVGDIAASVVLRRLRSLEEQATDLRTKYEGEVTKTKKGETDHATVVSDLTTKLNAKDAQVVTLEKQLGDSAMTPAKLDALVKDRALVVGKARAVLGTALVVDGKSIDDIRKQVVDAKIGDAAKAWSADSIAASFATLTKDVADGGGTDDYQSVDNLAAGFSGQPGFAGAGGGYGGNSGNGRTNVYDAYDKSLETAWKGQAAAK